MTPDTALSDTEYADATKKRVMSAEQRAQFAKSWKRAKDAGKLKGPMRISTARLLLDAATK